MPNKEVRKCPIGGVYLPEEKGLTRDQAIKIMPDPAEVAIPLAQHIGAPAKPIVEKGDYVKKGECIAELQGRVSARVHASINGIVKGVVERKKPGQGVYECILIERDDSGVENEAELDKSNSLPEVEIIRDRVKAAGVIGMGGAGFPTHIKLSPTSEMEIDTVIINGAECEPFLTVDHRLLLEKGEELFRGLELIKKAVGAEKGIVAIEINKEDAIIKLEELAVDWPGIEVQALDTRYPHGAEKQLTKAVLNREVPTGELPMAVNVVVNNVQTAIKIARAVDLEEAVTDRVLTVSGKALKTPSNVKVPIGSSIKDILEFCGGANQQDYQIIVGGPMTGINVDDESIPIVKCTSGLVLMTAEEYDLSETRTCIRCAKCSEVCPMYLAPNRITAFINNDLIERSVETGLMDCIECGACAYICPSKRPLVRWLKRGKAEHRANDN